MTNSGPRIGILVVDDDPDLRLVLRVVVETVNQGLFIESEASSAFDAFELLQTSCPDVIVIDHEMPGMTGVEAASKIHERWPDLPIVLFSAYLDSALRAEATAAGITRVCGKHEMNDLLSSLRELTAS